MNIASGRTHPSDWKDYDSYVGGVGDGITVEVDTSAGRFQKTPHYIPTIEFEGELGGTWRLSGPNAVYAATPTGFKVHLGWADTTWAAGNDNVYPNPITAADAKRLGWYIRWTGIEAP